jgi:CheY-like chemotaxis protein
VVEDDPCIREALLIELETVGFRVATAANGKEALAAIRKGPRPSVIVTDLMMPVMDGWQLRAELLRDRKLASIPVVVLTARGDAERQARSRRGWRSPSISTSSTSCSRFTIPSRCTDPAG